MPIVRRNEPISNWGDGDFVQGFALLCRKEVRQDRNGREYLDIELCDASGSLGGRVWPDNPVVKGDFREKDFVAFQGTVRLYRANGFDEALLIPSTPEDLDDLWRRFAAIYPGELRRPALRALAAAAQERYGAAVREHPAAKQIHHAYRGGLLEHLVAMAELAIQVAAQYPELDRDLLLLGVYFHDLGKLRELGAMPANDYTLEGQLVGHIAIGLEMLGECAAAVPDLPRDLLLHLQHLVASHHGRREFGSPVEPATAEAFALHYIDNLDSKLGQLRNLRRGGAEGLQYVRALGRTVYFDRPEAGDGEAEGDGGEPAAD